MSEAGKRRTSWVAWVVLLLLLVVIGIGIFLSPGGPRPDSKRRATLSHLKLLQGLMQDFINEGKPEPGVPSPWVYGGGAPAAYVETSPSSDPIEWIVALRSDPVISKKLATFAMSNDKDVPKLAGYTSVSEVVLDAWETPIRYVPKDLKTGKGGYFMSAGPDRKFSTMVPAPATPLRVDEIFSTDPG